MTQAITVAFIGGGNMTVSLAGGVSGDAASPRVIISEPKAEQRERLARLFPAAQIVADNALAAAEADVVVLAVKPQVMQVVAEGLRPALARKPLILSIAAGVTVARLDAWLGGVQPVVRAMPNTPALVGSGATGLFANARVDERQRGIAERIMRSVGLVQWFDVESQLDAVTALSGSGPAYVFLLMEALETGGATLGLAPEVARVLALQTVFGAAKLALESDDSPATLRERVTSPGGTTQAALQVFEDGELRELVSRAMQAAAQRARELAGD
ncbi:pyrroline-5-carboxylate reductase [Acidihalobacter ferrooxydans]|uniref:Pyrroline-5-carboxylate reductase n=1 Tax=Acidihalobacter ferrooxydans TaxID=1765967 RepID=A0A1P8UIB0_9GAMM|nr:pyrroline-5-carboxylate reductase [Acidihalobacter ferrooxydans]APZ43557.1 pyrroline-5-carboxylate reductase [Acidihalobacter ferrooxydans]